MKEIGDGVWSDPVHLTKAMYIAIAELLLKVSSELASKPEADVTPDYKRPRDNSGNGDMYSGGGGPLRPKGPPLSLLVCWQQRAALVCLAHPNTKLALWHIDLCHLFSCYLFSVSH